MAIEGVGSQRNREENQDTPVQDLVRPVLLYGWETWKITKTGERKLNSFQSQTLTALEWKPGPRVRGRPMTTRRRTIERGRGKVRWRSWNVA